MDDGDFIFGYTVTAGKRGAGLVAVRDDMAHGLERRPEERGQGFSRAHRRDDRAGGAGALDTTGVAISHAAHAEYEVERGRAGDGGESGGKPVETTIEGLEADARDLARYARG